MFIFLISLFLGFFITLSILPNWIKKAKSIDLMWKDMNKFQIRKVAGSGGIAVIAGFITGVFYYIAVNTFYFQTQENFIEIFALTSSLLIVFCIGIVDDLLGWRKGGLRKRIRMLLILIAAIPLIVINAGQHTISIPFLGSADLGLFYPLFIIPIGILGATATFNFLAGFNGLEAGQGIIVLSALAIVSYYTNSAWLTVLGLIMVFCLIAFLIYNKFPSKIFPGDSLTYPVGALIAIMAVLGNYERIAVFFFIPYIIEVVLKSRGKLIKQSFGKPLEDNSLDLAYEKIYGLEHFFIMLYQKLGVKPTERKIVLGIHLFQMIIIILGFILFREHIFI